jgi:DNA-binding transcriptional MerR regulator
VAETRATIPDRDVFKAAEVCEIAGVQSYVLRSWELEFPAIGASRSPGGPRVYRRADVERILRIKDLVFSEGLTLAGARRRLEEEDAPADEAAPVALVDAGAREKLGEIRSGLRALLDMLADAPPKKPGSWLPAAQPTLLEFEGADGARDAAAPAGGTKKRAQKKRARS